MSKAPTWTERRAAIVDAAQVEGDKAVSALAEGTPEDVTKLIRARAVNNFKSREMSRLEREALRALIAAEA